MNFLPSITIQKEGQRELSLGNYWHIIRKRKRFAVTFFAIAVITTALYSFLHPKIYQATTTILIERGSKNILSFDNIFPVQTAGLDYYPTQYKILKSRWIAKRVMDHLDLWRQFSWSNDPVEAFLHQIQIIPVKESRLVEVAAFSQSPQQATDIANAVVQFYIEQNLENKLTITNQAVEWLQGRIGSVREKLNRSELQFEVVKLKKELFELNERYLPKHPQIIRTQSRIKMLEGQLGEDITKSLEPGSLAVLYKQLEREVESSRKIYDTILARLKETMVAKGMEDTNVMVIDQAEVPKRPVAPRILLNILLSIFVGALGGAGLCLVFESLDNTLKSPEDIEQTAQLPVLGIIGKWDANSKELIVHEEPASPIAEFFRAIRTSLLFSSPDNPVRTLLITSPFSEEGKTVVAANLAVVIAQSGARVLLIDADMRKPRLYQMFGQENTGGLSHALTSLGSPTEFIYKTPIENLSVLFSGPIPPTPSELLGSQKMRDLIRRLLGDFDYLIFDSPPFMAATDPVVLGTFLDGVVFVTRYDKTPKDVLARGKHKFLEVKAKLVGVILNAVDLKQEHYRYSTYSYDYRSAHREVLSNEIEAASIVSGQTTEVRRPPTTTSHSFPP